MTTAEDNVQKRVTWLAASVTESCRALLCGRNFICVHDCLHPAANLLLSSRYNMLMLCEAHESCSLAVLQSLYPIWTLLAFCRCCFDAPVYSGYLFCHQHRYS